jgi:CBS domain-containing protein
LLFIVCGGERGIRTPGPVTVNGFQDRRVRPLCQLSGAKIRFECFRPKLIYLILIFLLFLQNIWYFTIQDSSSNFYCMNKKVSDILLRKSINLITISPDKPVIEALQIMADKNIGSVVVMADGLYKGLITERDYSRKIILKGRSSTETKVGEIMSSDLPFVKPADTIDHCMQLMSDKNIRYLPVFENDSIMGILSINDVVRETILSHEETITHLTDYVHSAI